MSHESHIGERAEEEQGMAWHRAWLWVEAAPEQRPYPAPPLPIGVRLPILLARKPWEVECCWLWVLLAGPLHFHMVFQQYETKRLTDEVFEIKVTSCDPPLLGVVLLNARDGGTG